MITDAINQLDYDPTKIRLENDPKNQYFSGVAIHGNTPFSVPYMSHIVGNLFIGGCRDGLVLPSEIEHVVSLYPWENYVLHSGVKTNLSVRMYDGDPQTSDELKHIARWASNRILDGPTLIHCQAGLNRSSLIGVLALMHLKGSNYTAQEAIDLIREKRSSACLCNKGFEKFLLEGENNV